MSLTISLIYAYKTRDNFNEGTDRQLFLLLILNVAKMITRYNNILA